MADSNDRAEKSTVGRRDFFKGAALGAAGLVVSTQNTEAAADVVPAPAPPGVPLPTDATISHTRRRKALLASGKRARRRVGRPPTTWSTS